MMLILYVNQKIHWFMKRLGPRILISVLLLVLMSTSYSAISNKIAKHPIPVIVDTDMGFDDWMALLYVAKNKKVNLIAVTIDCNGETYCKNNAGAKNAARLLMLAGKPNVNVYSGISQSANYWPTFPNMIREQATNMHVTGFKDMLFNKDTIKSISAPEALAKLIEKAGKQHKPITLISIGSATNIDDALEFASHQSKKARNLFKMGISMIYKGGGAFGLSATKSKKSKHDQLSNDSITGNLLIPDIYVTNNTQAAWNIYVAAEKAQHLLQSGLPITFVPVNLSDQLPITKAAYDLIKKQAHNKNAASFIANTILDTVKLQGGWKKVALDFWDPSVVVSALNPQLITKQYSHVSVCINTRNKQNDFMGGYRGGHFGKTPIINYLPKSEYYYAAILINIPYNINSNKKMYRIRACDLLHEKARAVDIYARIDRQKFYNEFIKNL